MEMVDRETRWVESSPRSRWRWPLAKVMVVVAKARAMVRWDVSTRQCECEKKDVSTTESPDQKLFLPHIQ